MKEVTFWQVSSPHAVLTLRLPHAAVDELQFELSMASIIKMLQRLPRFAITPSINMRTYATLILQVLKEAGGIGSDAMYVNVHLNGKFYGLHAFIMSVDNDMLKVRLLMVLLLN